MARDDVTRRRLLQGAATTAGGLALSTAPSGAATLLGDDDFEETEYGYVRTDYERPAVGDRPVILTVDGYAHGSPTHYVEMRDGQLMAVDVAVEPDERAWRAPPVSEEYVCVHASIRGTGCSAGSFDLYDRTHAKDGYESSSGSPIAPGRRDGSASTATRTPGSPGSSSPPSSRRRWRVRA